MIYVGIDVAKDKHDCFITNSDGEVLYKPFTISNNKDGFDELYNKIFSTNEDLSKIKVGLEATGHYSYNLLGFLVDKGLTTFVINPLHTNLYRKSLSLRQTKTDKVDARTIASMLMSDVNLKSYSDISYHNEELKSLTRYRFDKVKERAKLKTSISRLVLILFPELEKLVSTLHIASVYALLYEFPGASKIASAHLTKLTNLLENASHGRYCKDTAIMLREAARASIGSNMPAKSLELKHTIKLMQDYLHQPINPDSLTQRIRIWKNVVPDIYDMLYLTQPNLFATGTQHFQLTLQRNVLKASIIMLLYHMLLKNLYESFTNWKNLVKLTLNRLNLS